EPRSAGTVDPSHSTKPKSSERSSRAWARSRLKPASRRAAFPLAATSVFTGDSLTLEIAEAGGARKVRLHVVAAALVDDLASHRIADVRRGVARRDEVAPHVVDAFAQHDLDPV